MGAAVCVRVRLPAPKGAHCSVAADGAAGVGEAADPAEGALLCGGGWGYRCG